MRFEHLIQINDPLMPLLDTLTREQLWRGLVQEFPHAPGYRSHLGGSLNNQALFHHRRREYEAAQALLELAGETELIIRAIEENARSDNKS